MRTFIFTLLTVLIVSTAHAQEPEGYPANYAKGPRFKALVYYTHNAEEAHYEFSLQAVEFFKKLHYGDGFILDITTDIDTLDTYEKWKDYSIVVMLDGYPTQPASRQAFQQYMERGGGWMGFHVAAYNDKNTNWPWFVDFLGIKDVVTHGDFQRFRPVVHHRRHAFKQWHRLP